MSGVLPDDVPDELADAFLMSAHGWSWSELQETPEAVIAYLGLIGRQRERVRQANG